MGKPVDNKLTDKAVCKINEWLEGFSKGVCEGTHTEFQYVRMAVLIPAGVMRRYHDVSRIPAGTTHVLMVAIECLDSDQPDIGYVGQEFWAKVDDTIVDIGDMDEIDDTFGGGPALTDANYNEAVDWMDRATSLDIKPIILIYPIDSVKRAEIFGTPIVNKVEPQLPMVCYNVYYSTPGKESLIN